MSVGRFHFQTRLSVLLSEYLSFCLFVFLYGVCPSVKCMYEVLRLFCLVSMNLYTYVNLHVYPSFFCLLAWNSFRLHISMTFLYTTTRRRSFLFCLSTTTKCILLSCLYEVMLKLLCLFPCFFLCPVF